jgi:hypothetical protein
VEDALAGGCPDVYAYVVAAGAVGGFSGMVHGASFVGFGRWCRAGRLRGMHPDRSGLP